MGGGVGEGRGGRAGDLSQADASPTSREGGRDPPIPPSPPPRPPNPPPPHTRPPFTLLQVVSWLRSIAFSRQTHGLQAPTAVKRRRDTRSRSPPTTAHPQHGQDSRHSRGRLGQRRGGAAGGGGRVRDGKEGCQGRRCEADEQAAKAERPAGGGRARQGEPGQGGGPKKGEGRRALWRGRQG